MGGAEEWPFQSPPRQCNRQRPDTNPVRSGLINPLQFIPLQRQSLIQRLITANIQKIKSIATPYGPDIDPTKPNFMRRILSELKSVHNYQSSLPEECLVTYAPLDPIYLTVFIGTLAGPPGTVYEGGMFHLHITVPDNYPFVPPKVRFLTPIYSPNVHPETGEICVEILERRGWAPVLQISSVLMSILGKITLPGADLEDKPLMLEIARLYRDERKIFDETAREWTKRYAMRQEFLENPEDIAAQYVVGVLREEDRNVIELGEELKKIEEPLEMSMELPDRTL